MVGLIGLLLASVGLGPRVAAFLIAMIVGRNASSCCGEEGARHAAGGRRGGCADERCDCC